LGIKRHYIHPLLGGKQMKRILSILLVFALFSSLSAAALFLYDDASPAPKGCKTCVYKAVIE
jgi:hypothetical protein